MTIVNLHPSAANPSGQLVESAVHVLGVSHGSPTNPRAVYEVASAVQPDAFAYEGPRQAWDSLRKAAGSTHLLPLLDKAMLSPIEDVTQAQEILSLAEQGRWRAGLKAAGLLRGPARSKDDVQYYVGGYLIYSDVLAGKAQQEDPFPIHISCTCA